MLVQGAQGKHIHAFNANDENNRSNNLLCSRATYAYKDWSFLHYRYLFGSDVVAQFNQANDIEMICRAHQLVMEVIILEFKIL